MRISKSTKTSVKASKKVCGASDKPLTKDQVKDLWDKKALFIDFGDSDAMCQDNGYTLDQILDYMDKGNQVYVDSDVEACGDVKASRTAKEKFLGTALLEDRDDGKIHLNNFPVAPNDRCRYMWKNTMFPTTWNTIDEAIDAIETTLGVRVDREQILHPTNDSIELYLYGTNKAIMSTTKVSANDQALTHIKAAIDILGKSGNKDEVTKDSIANLAIVMMDLNSQK